MFLEHYAIVFIGLIKRNILFTLIFILRSRKASVPLRITWEIILESRH